MTSRNWYQILQAVNILHLANIANYLMTIALDGKHVLPMYMIFKPSTARGTVYNY